MIDEHNSSSECPNEKVPHPNIMSVMVTGVDTSENRMVEFGKMVNMLMKALEEMGYKIESLNNQIVTLLNQVIHILSRMLTKERQLYKKVNHKI